MRFSKGVCVGLRRFYFISAGEEDDQQITAAKGTRSCSQIFTHLSNPGQLKIAT